MKLAVGRMPPRVATSFTKPPKLSTRLNQVSLLFAQSGQLELGGDVFPWIILGTSVTDNSNGHVVDSSVLAVMPFLLLRLFGRILLELGRRRHGRR